MRQFLNNVMLVVDLVMLVAGLLLLADGYVVWSTRHESDWPRANYSFVYLIPGWALTVMGYVGWRIEGVRAARQSGREHESV